MLIDVTQDTPRPALDVAGATALLVVLAPLLVLLALLVVISDGRGPFFTQQRAGQGGPALHPLALVRQPGR